MRAKFSLTDQEIVRRREEGATIIKLNVPEMDCGKPILR